MSAFHHPTVTRGLDRFGVLASSLCLVHCLAMPLVVATAPLFASERLEGALAVALVGCATLSAGLGAARRRFAPLLPYGLGMVVLVGLAVGEVAHGSPQELLGTTLAAALMIGTHLASLAAAPCAAPRCSRSGSGERPARPRSHRSWR